MMRKNNGGWNKWVMLGFSRQIQNDNCTVRVIATGYRISSSVVSKLLVLRLRLRYGDPFLIQMKGSSIISSFERCTHAQELKDQRRAYISTTLSTWSIDLDINPSFCVSDVVVVVTDVAPYRNFLFYSPLLPLACFLLPLFIISSSLIVHFTPQL